MTHSTPPSLLSRVRDLGDAAAWQEFDTRYRDLIRRYCRRRGLQAADAEDVRQIVMLNLANAMREFEYRPERGRFRDYLGRVIENAVRRLFRRPRIDAARLDTHDMEELSAPFPTELTQQWEREWMLHHYRLALSELRRSFDVQSTAMFEALLSGQSVAEVAETFGVSQVAVHKVKQRIRDRLKALIARQLYDEEDLDVGPQR